MSTPTEIATRSSKELRREEADSTRAAYLLRREFERVYKKDQVGLEYSLGLLNIISRFLDHIDAPLALAGDFDAACDLRGSWQFQLERINRTFAVLQPRKEELERLENITSLGDRRKKA
jgi:hypothetical protein